MAKMVRVNAVYIFKGNMLKNNVTWQSYYTVCWLISKLNFEAARRGKLWTCYDKYSVGSQLSKQLTLEPLLSNTTSLLDTFQTYSEPFLFVWVIF